MKIRIVKQLDLNNITLMYELEGCPEDCTVPHCDLDDFEQEHDFDAQPTAYHNDPWEGEDVSHWMMPEDDDDLNAIAEAYETQELGRQRPTDESDVFYLTPWTYMSPR